ncbi:hypothetical protein [Enterobacter cloacae]|nr:hypothetical protein [Enterobacter cloacae]
MEIVDCLLRKGVVMNRLFCFVKSFSRLPKINVKALICFVFSFFIFVEVSHASSSHMSNDNVASSSVDHKTDELTRFNQAVDYDLSGNHAEARKLYNLLKNSRLSSLVAVPSAINLVDLNKVDAAEQAFNEIVSGGALRDRDYARLWQLWMLAKRWAGKQADLVSELKEQAGNKAWSLSWENDIALVYAGKKSPQDVLRIMAQKVAKGEADKDALTETVFFITGYLHYVQHDVKSAKKYARQYQSSFNYASLERPLIEREYIAGK